MELHSGSEIVELQNSKPMLKMLAAQRQLYTEAKRDKAAAAATCLGLPLATTAVQLATSLTLPPTALCVALEIITFVAGIALSALAERKIAVAASVQQCFDLELYGLEKCDRRNLARSIVDASERYKRSSKDFRGLLDWYGTDISDLEPIAAIRCCQKTNASWSLNLGRLWMGILMVAGSACFAVVIVAIVLQGIDPLGVFFGATIVEWLVLQLVDGFSYLLQVRDLNKMMRAIDIDSKSNVLRIQNLIFEYRKSRFKVPDFLYRTMRKRYSTIADSIAAAERL